MSNILIKLPQPFSVDWALTCVRSSSFGTPYYPRGENRLRRVLAVAGEPALVEFEFCRTKHELGVELITPHPQACRDPAADLLATAAHLWGLTDDLDSCYCALGRDPVVAPLLRRFAGLRMVRAPGLYEALLSAILGQQISVASAQSVRRRLMAGLGERLMVEGESYATYPSPTQLLAADLDGLQGLGITRQKSRYLLEVAERATAGALEGSRFEGVPDQEAIRRLCEIPGIGRWTAEVALMYGLGRLDVLFAGDLALQSAVQGALGLPTRPGEAELRQVGEGWAGWRSYAALYLMMTLKHAE